MHESNHRKATNVKIASNGIALLVIGLTLENTISMKFHSLTSYDAKSCSTDSYKQHTNVHSQKN